MISLVLKQAVVVIVAAVAQTALVVVNHLVLVTATAVAPTIVIACAAVTAGHIANLRLKDNQVHKKVYHNNMAHLL